MANYRDCPGFPMPKREKRKEEIRWSKDQYNMFFAQLEARDGYCASLDHAEEIVLLEPAQLVAVSLSHGHQPTLRCRRPVAPSDHRQRDLYRVGPGQRFLHPGQRRCPMTRAACCTEGDS